MLSYAQLRSELRLFSAIAVLLLCATAYEAWHTGLTIDEPSHLISSHLYWHGRDRLYPRDMPPLMKIAGGWPSRLMGLPVAPDLGHRGDKRTEWSMAAELMAKLPAHRVGAVIFWSRLPMMIFPLAALIVLWRWARALHGPTVGLIVAAMWAVSPAPLAHGALLKNDLAATSTYLLFWFAAWHYWRKPGLTQALAMSAAAGLVLLSKMSMLFIAGAAPLVILLRALRPPRRPAILGFLLSISVPYAIVLTAYQFEFHWTSREELARLWVDPDVPKTFTAVAHVFEWLPAPEAMWTGVISLIKANAHPVPVYLLGQVYPDGNPWYFVVAALLKMAFPTLILIGIGLVVMWRRRWEISDLLWLVPGFLYFAMASMASLHLGVRLILPSWPFFFLISGFAIDSLLRTRVRQAAFAALAFTLLVLSVRAYPHGISYFNPYAGPPQHALRYLADSNIDWGQALPEAADFVRRRKIPKLRLSYFGFDKADRYFEPGVIELIAPPWSQQLVQSERLQPEPGWYAISATLLPGHFFAPEYQHFYADFWNRRPVATPGGSIFIYRVE